MSSFAKYRAAIAAGGGFLGGFGFSSLIPDNLKAFISSSSSSSSKDEEPANTDGNWDHNWDKLHPVKSSSALMAAETRLSGRDQEKEKEKEKEKENRKKVKVANHIILVRHGQYNTRGKTDEEKKLTDLGKLQAEVTGMRLAELNLPYTTIVKSTMTRAQETSALIESYVADEGVAVVSDPLLVEGFPVAPDPPLKHINRPDSVPHQDGPRIEAAFRKYVHRAEPHHDHDRYSVIVCHANVIRYFVCRALQFPPEAWLRLSLNHASITWISVTPSGRVILRCYGETGHMLPQWISSR